MDQRTSLPTQSFAPSSGASIDRLAPYVLSILRIMVALLFLQNFSKGVWNPEDERLFPPKRVGIGWTINFHALLKRIGIIK
jgi:hypothetical protein